MSLKITERDKAYAAVKALIETERVPFSEIDRSRIEAIGISKQLTGRLTDFVFYHQPLVARVTTFTPLNPNQTERRDSETMLLAKRFSMFHYKAGTIEVYWFRKNEKGETASIYTGSESKVEVFGHTEVIPVYQGDSNYQAVLNLLEEAK